MLAGAHVYSVVCMSSRSRHWGLGGESDRRVPAFLS